MTHLNDLHRFKKQASRVGFFPGFFHSGHRINASKVSVRVLTPTLVLYRSQPPHFRCRQPDLPRAESKIQTPEIATEKSLNRKLIRTASRRLICRDIYLRGCETAVKWMPGWDTVLHGTS